MGVDIMLEKDGKYLLNLGRYYSIFDSIADNAKDINYDDIQKEKLELNGELLNLITRAIAAMAGKREALNEMGLDKLVKYGNNQLLDEILLDIKSYLEYYMDEVSRLGKKELLSWILEEEGFSINFE